MSPNAALPLLLLTLSGCGAADEPARGAPPPAAQIPAFELGDVVARALSARPEPAALEPLDDLQREDLEGLTILVSSTPSMTELARTDAARMGSGAWSFLGELARDPRRADDERAAAIDLLPPRDVQGAQQLLALVAQGEPAWVRARAAWRLATDGPDHLVPGLLLRLKYEKDHETVIWIATALARHGNLAGLDGLMTIAADPGSPARANAAYQIESLLERFGRASAGELWAAWQTPAGERDFPDAPRSEEYRFAILEWIARFEEFQLRGVDDARFVLERMDDVAARELAAALHDADVYTRVHAAQCLQRMGRRGLSAGPELLKALADPLLASNAVAALGQVDYAPAQGALLNLLEPGISLALRLASARALGHLPSLTAQEARQALQPLLEGDPPELAQAAAESLLRRDPDDLASALRLADWLEREHVDTSSSERALRDWLRERQAPEALARWDALSPPRERAETLGETRDRLRARSEFIRELARDGAQPAGARTFERAKSQEVGSSAAATTTSEGPSGQSRRNER